RDSWQQLLSGGYAAAPGGAQFATGDFAGSRLALLRKPGPDVGTRRAAAGAAGRRGAGSRQALDQRTAPFHLSQLLGFRYLAPVARHEASDRSRVAFPRLPPTQCEARLRRHPRTRIYRAGADADIRGPRSAPAHGAHGRGARPLASIRLYA